MIQQPELIARETKTHDVTQALLNARQSLLDQKKEKKTSTNIVICGPKI